MRVTIEETEIYLEKKKKRYVESGYLVNAKILDV